MCCRAAIKKLWKSGSKSGNLLEMFFTSDQEETTGTKLIHLYENCPFWPLRHWKSEICNVCKNQLHGAWSHLLFWKERFQALTKTSHNTQNEPYYEILKTRELCALISGMNLGCWSGRAFRPVGLARFKSQAHQVKMAAFLSTISPHSFADTCMIFTILRSRAEPKEPLPPYVFATLRGW